jgi:hypothetical protein
MIVSTVVSAIAFTTIVVVTIVLANQTKTAKEDIEGRIRNVVDQVNTSQQYSYEFDKRQQQQLTGLEKNVSDVRTSYVTKADAQRQLDTKQLNATKIDSDVVQMHSKDWNDGAIKFSSTQEGASKHPEYMIQRGGKGYANHLVINTPAEKGAGINFMASGGKSRMFIDNSTGQVNVPGVTKTSVLQLGDKFKLSGVGDAHANDGWLRLMDKDGKGYYGGVAAANIWTKDSAHLNGTTHVNGPAYMNDTLNIKGGKSELNPKSMQTVFPASDGKNYIRGDTNLTGNLTNAGDVTIERSLQIGKEFTVKGKSTMGKPVKIGHSNAGGWYDSAALSVFTKPGEVGASFGSTGWSHFPYSDGNTYIRPGVDNKNINIGDWGAAEVNIGRGNTATTIKGNLTVNNPNWNWINAYRNNDDQVLIGGDATNKGIWTVGNRDFNIYTSGTSRFGVNKDGLVTSKGNVAAPSIGRAQNDNDWFRINYLNAANKSHPGTAVYGGMVVNTGGGLSVGDLKKIPEGQINVKNAIKVRHDLTGWVDNAAISTWTPKQAIGPSFGGPDNWSHFPYSDGNTYIRSGVANGKVMIGDAGTSTVQIGSDAPGSLVKLGRDTWLPNTDGHSYIRPGRPNYNVYVGDKDTNEVNLGRLDGTGSVISRPFNMYTRRHIDAWDNWNNSGKTLFGGWRGDKVVLGNDKLGGADFANSAPKNTVVATNDMKVFGKVSSKNALCVNDTCLTEGDIKVIKSWL